MPSFLLLLLLTAASGQARAVTDTESGFVRCTEPRPEACTMDYTPVCGLQTAAGEEHWRTYSNGCTACTDVSIAGFRPGACKSEDS